ncbi:MAG: Anaerobic sulfite reductase subunit A [Bacteroidetes bacterium ADurb.Bin145]|jgi:ferredoxin|nr:MAG: Anaerobic sulfite reductase subunit A [Bacteroidetes bacterium ADurb.Bin145]
MQNLRCINKEDWNSTLKRLLVSHLIYATTENNSHLDYELITEADVNRISYNRPKPVTPLKSFFLPVSENVTATNSHGKPRIIIGTPNCDTEGLGILDEMYLDKDFKDIFYKSKRENTILISADCFGILEHCHCLSYGIKPYSNGIADLSILEKGGMMIFRILSTKGEQFLNTLTAVVIPEDKNIVEFIEEKHSSTESLLKEANKGLPDYKRTGSLVSEAKKEIWKKYSAKCVSCGACATICPTCTCFLLIDKPGFEKIKQLDACQYPGFERVAGGEDGLAELPQRFRNRYMCKYVWKPERFNSVACTGCGRCIEACIGKINKNELFMELA